MQVPRDVADEMDRLGRTVERSGCSDEQRCEAPAHKVQLLLPLAPVVEQPERLTCAEERKHARQYSQQRELELCRPGGSRSSCG
eukprot:COSAG06_NODE_27610_length_590_cov_0.525458_1_plen_83_part_10